MLSCLQTESPWWLASDNLCCAHNRNSRVHVLILKSAFHFLGCSGRSAGLLHCGFARQCAIQEVITEKGYYDNIVLRYASDAICADLHKKLHLRTNSQDLEDRFGLSYKTKSFQRELENGCCSHRMDTSRRDDARPSVRREGKSVHTRSQSPIQRRPNGRLHVNKRRCKWMWGTGNGPRTSDAPMEPCWRLDYGAGPAGIGLDNHIGQLLLFCENVTI